MSVLFLALKRLGLSQRDNPRACPGGTSVSGDPAGQAERDKWDSWDKRDKSRRWRYAGLLRGRSHPTRIFGRMGADDG